MKRHSAPPLLTVSFTTTHADEVQVAVAANSTPPMKQIATDFEQV